MDIKNNTSKEIKEVFCLKRKARIIFAGILGTLIMGLMSKFGGWEFELPDKTVGKNSRRHQRYHHARRHRRID